MLIFFWNKVGIVKGERLVGDNRTISIIIIMVNSSALRLLGGALGAGGVGWLGGVSYQKYLQDSAKIKNYKNLPGLPSESTVSVGRCNFPPSLKVEI